MMMDTHKCTLTCSHTQSLTCTLTQMHSHVHTHTNALTLSHTYAQNRDSDKKIAPLVNSSVTHTKLLN